MARSTPVVGILMGSDSDLAAMAECARVLEGYGVVYDVRVLSAHRTPEQATAFAREAEARGLKLVMEEFLPGEEVSFLVLSDGARVVPMVSVQDHKRALEEDKGPMTGGMGTVSPATNMSLDMHKQVMNEVVLPTISGLAAEGRRFQGVLFVGLMIT